MPQDFSYDVVSKVDLQEVANAVQQAYKEIATRFDFRGSPSKIDWDEKELALTLSSDDGGTRVLLTPRAPRPDLAWLRIAIGADDNLRTLAYEDSSGSRSEFRFEAWRREKARPASDYRITGPPGTRILEN